MNFYYSKFSGIDFFTGAKTRVAIRESIGLDYIVFPKTEFSENSTDLFGDGELKVWYTNRDMVSEVQINFPYSQLYIFDSPSLGVPLEELEVMLEKINILFELDEIEGGIDIFQKRFRFSAPDFFERGMKAIVESVVVDVSAFSEGK